MRLNPSIGLRDNNLSMSQTTILPFSSKYERDCADIIAALPEWFGIPESNASYLENLNKFSSWVAMIKSKVVGVISLENPFQGSFEIHFMAVHPDFHRQWIGKLLVKQVEDEARKSDGKWLHVKTLSPTHSDPNYAFTREFYFTLGFKPLFESDSIWGPDNPAIILIKSLWSTTIGCQFRSKISFSSIKLLYNQIID